MATSNRLRLFALLEFGAAGYEVGHGGYLAAGAFLLAGGVFAWLSWGPRY